MRRCCYSHAVRAPSPLRRAQSLDGIPRVNRGFQPVPSNIGELDWFQCQEEGVSHPEHPCYRGVSHHNTIASQLPSKPALPLAVRLATSRAHSRTSPLTHPPLPTPTHQSQQWRGGPSTQVSGSRRQPCPALPHQACTPPTLPPPTGVAIAFAFLFAVFSVLFCIGRYCCCCIKGGVCGRRHPTLRTHFLGFEPRPPFHYRAVEVWGTQALMWTYCAFVVVFIIVGNVRGNQGFTEAQKAMVRSPSGLMDTAKGLTNPMANLVVSMAGRLAVPAVLALNSTLTDAVSLDNVQSKLTCITTTVQDALPDLGVISNTVNEANNSKISARQDLTSVNSSLLVLQSELDEVQRRINVTDQLLAEFESAIPGVNTSLSGIRVEVQQVKSPYVDEWSSPSIGLAAMSSGLSDLSNLPSDTDFHNAAGHFDPDPPSGGAVGTTNYNDRAAELAAIDAVEADFDASGDHGELADTLEAHNSRRAYFLNNKTASSVISAAESLNASIASMPDLAELRASLEALEEVLGAGFNGTTQARDGVVSLNATLITFPPLTPIIDELARVQNIGASVTCALELLEELATLNRSVVLLPDAINNIEGTLDQVNETRKTVDESVETLQETSRTLDQVTANISETLSTAVQQLDDVEAQRERLASGNSTLNFTSIYEDIDDLGASLDALNLTQLVDAMQSFNDTLADPAVEADPTLIAALRTLDAEVDEFRAAADAYHLFHESGVCTSAPQSCDPTGIPCPSGDCETGVNVCTGDYQTSCFDDSDCSSAGGTCLLQRPTLQAGPFPTYTTGAFSGTAALQGSLDAAAAALDDVPDLDQQLADIDSTQSNLGSFDIAGYRQQLQDLSAELSVSGNSSDSSSGGDGEPSPLQAGLQDARQQLNAFALNEVDQQVSELEVTLSSLNSSLDQLSRFKDSIITMQDFLFRPSGVRENLDRIDEANLERVREEEGVDAMLLLLAEEFQGIVDKAGEIMNGFTDLGTNGTADAGNSSLISIDLPKQLNDSGVLEYVRILSSDEKSRHGAIHFFGSLALGEDNTVASAGGTAFRDANGNEYPDGKRCLTNDCLDNTIDELNAKPLSESSAAGPPGSVPVPLSREQIFFLPYAPVLIIMLIGLVSTVNCFKGNWQAYTSCCSALCISLCAPLLFLFVGGLFFPMSIVAHDICRGGPNVAYTYVAGSQHSICVSLGGTPDVSAGVCHVPVLGAENSTFAVNIEEMAAAVLGDCSYAPDAFDNFWLSLDDAFATAPEESINSTIESSQGSAGAIQPRLARDLRGMARNASGVVGRLLEDVSEVLGCSAVNNKGYKPFKDAMCCEVFDAYYWYVTGLYMCAFSMVFCGWGASIMGRKRFVAKLWGPELEHAEKTWKMTADGVDGEGGVVIDLATHVEGDDLLSGPGGGAMPPAQGQGGDMAVVQVGAAPAEHTYTPGQTPKAGGKPDFAGDILAAADAEEANASAPPPSTHFKGSNPMYSDK